MGIGNEFFFEDKHGNIRVNINDEVFNIITSERKEANEMMLVLLTELFKELNELAGELANHQVSEKMQDLLEIVNYNHNNYIINQARIIKRIEEIEGGN